MPNRLLLPVLFVLLPACSSTAQSQNVQTGSPSVPDSAHSSVVSGFAFPLPADLYSKWRKYGQWDYKQQGSKYRDYTLFNFGATGSAAGIPQNALIALSNSSKPQQSELEALDGSELQEKFVANFTEFEKLRKMAGEDSRLIRIAPDFTWLDGDSKWPREEIGISESRWDEYRGVFKKLSISEGLVRNEDFPGAIFFVALAKGLCTGGSSAGFVHSSEKLRPIAQSVPDTLKAEAQRDPKKHQTYVFKVLKDNWYTFYEVDW